MQTLIFTQKLLRQRSFLSFIIPLLALFLGLGATQAVSAQGYVFSNVNIIAQTTSTATSSTTLYYGKRNVLGQIPFNGAALGGTSGGVAIPFDPANGGVLTLNAASFRTSAANTPSSTTIYQYRVYLAGTAVLPSYSIVNLADQGNGIDFANPAAGVNLLTQPGVLGGGNYIVEIQARYTDNDPLNNFPSYSDPSATSGNMATFSLVSPAVTPVGGTTTWVGGATGAPNDWLTAANWNNGVPSARANAIIPSPPRPNAPILNNNTADYSVKNLTLQIQDPANAFTTRGLVRITTATLKIYGDVANGGNGILATTDAPGTLADPLSASAIIVFAGSDQKIDQGRFANLIIQNNKVDQATGAITPNTVQAIKSNFGVLEIPGSLQFANNANVLLRSTVSDLSGNLSLDTGGNENVDLKNTGSVLGETNTAFMQGILKVQRPVNTGVKETFGGVGIDITILGSSTAGVGQITRATGATFSPVMYSGATRPVSVKRSFGVSFSGLQQGFNADVVFHYNNNADELNTNRDGFLQIFRTTSNATFQRLGGIDIPDPTSYPGNGGTVEVMGLNSINTLTLADYERNPLPVTLISFSAKRVGTDAVMTWETASELNNKGYNVQVSTDGNTFRTIGFVASESVNSTTAKTYSFTDTEKNKVGVRYYRLQQVDVDGKTALFAPRAVTFEGRATASGVLAYPNPFTNEVRLNLTSATEGNGLVRITDMTGRLIGQRQVALIKGANDVEVSNVYDLKSGLYMMNVTLPNGETKNLKVVKQ